jgi:NADH-quinone oxidoreductase subunit G
MLPGRVARAEGAAWFEKAWATVPRFDGADATGILTAAAEGKIDTLVLLGADPLSDFPDRELAERALIGARTLIAVDRFLTPSAARASVVLAAAGFAEVDGSTTNLEGRISLVRQKVTPPGVARPDWQIAAAIADRLGSDLGFDTTADIWAEIEELSVVHAGVTLAALHSPEAVDGIVVPLPLPLPMPEAAADSDADSAAELEAGTEDAAPADATTDDAADAEPQDTVEADTVDVDLVEAPEMVRFVAVAVQEPPAVDAYSLRLVVTRSMYDMGTSLQHCHSSAGLAGTAVLRLHPLDFETAGISSEGRVKVLNGARSIVVRAAADAKIPRGVAALSHAPRDADVNRLVDVTSPVTDVRLEAL